jgi:hypothetical protein
MDRAPGIGPRFTRRHLLGAGIAGVATALAPAIGAGRYREEAAVPRGRRQGPDGEDAEEGRLRARPAAAAGAAPTGLQPLGWNPGATACSTCPPRTAPTARRPWC